VCVLVSLQFCCRKLRHLFVKHEGKKKLHVQVDHMVLGHSTREQWEQDVFSDFSKQIKEQIGKTSDYVVSNFSTTTPAMRAASEITLMSAMKEFFEMVKIFRSFF
jgi:hypothetical protein